MNKNNDILIYPRKNKDGKVLWKKAEDISKNNPIEFDFTKKPPRYLTEGIEFPDVSNMEEDLESFTPVSSRIAHLVVIDVLATGVALHRKPLLKEHLKRLEKSQRALRTPGPG